MVKCRRCDRKATIGYYVRGYSDTVFSFCSHDCFESFWTYNGKTIDAITTWFTQLSPEDYTAYCAMEAL